MRIRHRTPRNTLQRALLAPHCLCLCLCLCLWSSHQTRAGATGPWLPVAPALHPGYARGMREMIASSLQQGTGNGNRNRTSSAPGTSPNLTFLEKLRILLGAHSGPYVPGQRPGARIGGRSAKSARGLRRTGGVPLERRIGQRLGFEKGWGRGRRAREERIPGRTKGGLERLLRRATKGIDSWQEAGDSWHQQGVQGVQKVVAGARWLGPHQRRWLKRVRRPARLWGPAKMRKPARLWGDASVHPRPPTPGFHTPLRTLAGKGRCKTVPGKPVVIKVSKYSDIVTRTRYPPWRTVTLELQRSFSLPQGLLLAANFSCTILRNKPGVKIVLSTTWADEPGITFYGTNNVLMTGISLKYGISKSSPPCKAEIFFIGREASTLTCPGIYIVRSFGIQVTKASIFGRIDVFKSIFVRLDSLVATMPESAYDKAKVYRDFDTHGVIRMGETSIGATIIASNNVISNCEVFGHWELITIYRGAVGVTIRNNYLHHFEFVGIRCGARVAEVMDCHHNYIGYNLIWNPPGYPESSITAVDNAGIYTCLHWFNPGNYITCNYIENQRFCHYLDFASSGVTIDGGVCRNAWTAVKVNNGKFNKVRSLVVVETRQFVTYISCVTVQVLKFPGNMFVRNWEAMRRAFYDTPTINRVYPYMKTMANPVSTAYKGKNCNPPGGLSAAATGKCSGLAYGNDVESFAFNTTPATSKFGFRYSLVPYLGCEKVPAMPLINRHVWYNVSKPAYAAKFINAPKFDFGVKGGSPIYKMRKTFKSCPRGRVGRKVVPSKVYYTDFNIGRPTFFTAMLQFPYGKISNRTLDVKV